MNAMLGRIALVPLLFSLTACFDLRQTFVVNDDGTAALSVAFSIDAALLLEDNESEVDLDDECDLDDIAERDLPGGLTRVSDIRVEEDALVCEYIISGPLSDFELLSTDISRDSGNFDLLTVEFINEQTVRVSSDYEFSDDDSDDDGGTMARAIKRMIAVNFRDHVIAWTVRAPSVLESSGEIAEDGRSTNWSLALDEAIENSGTHHFEAVIDIKEYPPSFF